MRLTAEITWRLSIVFYDTKIENVKNKVLYVLLFPKKRFVKGKKKKGI